MNDLKSFLAEYKWRVIGIVGGISLTILLLTIGFLKTLLLVALTLTFYFIGKAMDKAGVKSIDELIINLLNKK